eukprot:TRINITY_DN10785_c0_g4_i1.p1 TRINITY_DN10785_c0_g4~~TRINITY_DN10785_c0_g4_i1.p1  ORF type:complete len:720 (+),score=74.54 TRINITY_DN10785_c0_g4_i1:1-2160(+)
MRARDMKHSKILCCLYHCWLLAIALAGTNSARTPARVTDAMKQVFFRSPDQYEQDELSRLAGERGWDQDHLVAHLCQSDEASELIRFHNDPPRCQELCDHRPELFANLSHTCRLSGIKRQWLDWQPDKLYIWNTDLHAGPIACNAPLLKEAGALVHAEIDFGNCKYNRKVCKDRLKVFGYDEWRGFSLDPCPNFLRQSFFEAYKNDPEFERVDAFICSHPAANCELFMPFNRSLIVYPTTRLEFGRHDDAVDWRKPYLNQRSHVRWKEWVANLQSIAANPMNVVAANSKFEVMYIKYHTGLDAIYLPSWCGGEATWPVILRPASRPEILLAPYRDNLDFPGNDNEKAWAHPILQSLSRAREDYLIANSKQVPEFVRLGHHYPHYETSDLVNHPCMVFLPYQVSVISFFEFYRMNIPIFVPSKKLLVSWHMEHNTLWERVYGHPAHEVPDETGMGDPYSDRLEDLEFWIGLSDYYQYDHVIQFDSWAHLLDLYFATDLTAVRVKMGAVNTKQRHELVGAWRKVLAKVQRHASPRRLMPKQFSHALTSLYQVPPLGPDPPLTIATRPNMGSGTPSATKMGRDCPVIRDDNVRCMCDEFVDFWSNPPCMQERTAAGERWWTSWCIPNQLWFPPNGTETHDVLQVPSISYPPPVDPFDFIAKTMPLQASTPNSPASTRWILVAVLFGLAVTVVGMSYVLCHVRHARRWFANCYNLVFVPRPIP